MNFGKAIEELKLSKKVSRQGWNGKGMFLALAYPNTSCCNEAIKFNHGYEGVSPILENFIVMKTADNKLVPWLASQTDVLAEDWGIIE